MELEDRLTELRALVDASTREEFSPAQAISPIAERFRAILEYHLGWRDERLEPLASAAPSGKKLRPALTLLVCEAVAGEINASARAAAVSIELVHNFSLVHDDIQDRGDLRRHRPTLWTLWGLEQGINAGDALFALAQLAILRQPGPVAAAMSAELNATCVRLVEGQYLDIEFQHGSLPVTTDAYQAMIERKTGGLFACACRLGAMAAGASQVVTDAYATFGLQLGLAFQQLDDALGVWGTRDDTGKPEAADVVERKRGLPATLALSRADAPAWLKEVYAAHNGAMSPRSVERVITHFDQLNLRAELEALVEQHALQALAALRSAEPREPAASYLAALCGLLVSRSA